MSSLVYAWGSNLSGTSLPYYTYVFPPHPLVLASSLHYFMVLYYIPRIKGTDPILRIGLDLELYCLHRRRGPEYRITSKTKETVYSINA